MSIKVAYLTPNLPAKPPKPWRRAHPHYKTVHHTKSDVEFIDKDHNYRLRYVRAAIPKETLVPWS